MGSYSSKVKPANPRKLDGSVFLEECLKPVYKNKPLWDYMISYNSKVYFIEVHPDNTANVKEMIKKVNWLQDWLKTKATTFLNMKADESKSPYRWVSTKRVGILSNSKQAGQLAKSGISFPKEVTHLP